jgi:ribosome-associated protein
MFPSMITDHGELVIAEKEIHEDFVRASGPGGQNVNKVATAVQLRFDIRHSPSLPVAVRERLIRLAGRRVTADGILVIQAQRFRSQEKNREDARARLYALIRQAAAQPTPRRTTKPTRIAKERRLESKKRIGRRKAMRRVGALE